MFAPVYECSRCGDVHHVTYVDDIDTDRDNVETVAVCRCGRLVRQKTIEGVPILHALTQDEIESENVDDGTFPKEYEEDGDDDDWPACGPSSVESLVSGV